MALRREFDLAPDYFANDTDARLVGDLSEAAGHTEFDGITQAEIEELVARMPRVGKAMVSMHRRLVAATGEVDTYRATVNRDGDSTPRASTPFEEVRDFFYDRKNYVHRLDMAAEEMFTRLGLRVGGLDEQLTTVLERDHDIRVVLADQRHRRRRRANAPTRRPGSSHSRGTSAPVSAPPIGHTTGFLTQGEGNRCDRPRRGRTESGCAAVAQVGLANYFAGALVLPTPSSTPRRKR